MTWVRAAVVQDGSVAFDPLATLDRVAARATMNLKVHLETPDSLAQIRTLLGGKAGGRGQVTLVSRIDSMTEVEIELPGHYPLSPAILQSIRTFPGVGEVVEV